MLNGDYVNQARGSSNFSTNVLMGAMANWGKFKGFSVNPELSTMSPKDILNHADLGWLPDIAETGYFNPVMQEWQGLGMDGADNFTLIRQDTGARIANVGRVMADAIRQGGCGYVEALEGLIGEYVNAGSVPMRCVSYDNGASMIVQLAISDGTAADRPYVNWLNLRDGLDGTTKRGYSKGNTCALCPNTFAQVKAETLLAYVKHTPGSIAGWRETVMESQNHVAETWANFRKTMEKLALIPVTPNQTENLAIALFGSADRQSEKRARYINAVKVSANDVNRSNATAEDLFAGLTRYVGQSTANRTENDQFAYVNGEGQKIVQRGLAAMADEFGSVVSGLIAR